MPLLIAVTAFYGCVCVKLFCGGCVFDDFCVMYEGKVWFECRMTGF